MFKGLSFASQRLVYSLLIEIPVKFISRRAGFLVQELFNGLIGNLVCKREGKIGVVSEPSQKLVYGSLSTSR